MKISVIMTCHNEERFIGGAIRSVYAQTVAPLIGEIIVVDDGSKDGSADLLRAISREIPILRVIRTDGIGLPAARNLAVRAARGEWISILDGDDIWAPHKLECQFRLPPSEHVGLLYSDFVDFTLDDFSDAQFISVRRYNQSTQNTLEKYFVYDAPIIPSSAVIRRAVFEQVGLFDEDIRLGEDTEMFLRIAENWRFSHIPGPLVYKRRHGGNLTHRLDKLLPVAEMLTCKFVSRNPSLAFIADKCMARRYVRIGNDRVLHQDRRGAVQLLFMAIKLDPWFLRAYANLLIAFIPSRMSIQILKIFRSAFHRANSFVRSSECAD